MQCETFYLPIARYRDINGKPTCAVSFPEKQFCHFYGTKRLGTQELCTYYQEPLYRRNCGNGTLIPLINCPLWKNHELSSDDC
jgi:hypothetical protein